MSDEEPLVMVEVQDTTPCPDNSTRDITLTGPTPGASGDEMEADMTVQSANHLMIIQTGIDSESDGETDHSNLGDEDWDRTLGEPQVEGWKLEPVREGLYEQGSEYSTDYDTSDSSDDDNQSDASDTDDSDLSEDEATLSTCNSMCKETDQADEARKSDTPADSDKQESENILQHQYSLRRNHRVSAEDYIGFFYIRSSAPRIGTGARATGTVNKLKSMFEDTHVFGVKATARTRWARIAGSIRGDKFFEGDDWNEPITL